MKKDKIKVSEVMADEGLIDALLASAPKENLHFIDRAMELTEQIYNILEKKGLNQKSFANSMCKSEAEVSKWLSGSHNFTLKSLALMETALGEEIFHTHVGEHLEAKHSGTTLFKVYAYINKNPPMLRDNWQPVKMTQNTRKTTFNGKIA